MCKSLSLSLKITSPEAIIPGLEIQLIIEDDRVVFPLPDSPTKAVIAPF